MKLYKVTYKYDDETAKQDVFVAAASIQEAIHKTENACAIAGVIV